MIKNNIWNRMFHSSEIEETFNKIKEYETLLRYESLIRKIKAAKTLDEVFAFHKYAWSLGFQNAHLGPCSWGMFRTESIPEMNPNEVYLGGIYGLFTKTIPEWNACKGQTYGYNGLGIDPNTSIYEVILNQYKKLLNSNIRSILWDAKEYLQTAQKLCYNKSY